MEAGATKYEEVMEYIKTLIERGILKPDERIPSIRKMAEETGFSTMTVLEGYKRLEEQGIIESRPQSGFYVRSPALWYAEGRRGVNVAQTEKIPIRQQQVVIAPEIEAMIEEAARADVVGFGAGLPDPALLPSEELSLRMARAVRQSPNASNRYSLKYGDPQLIQALERWMAGYHCIPRKDEIVITSGCSQALLISLRAVCNPGDTVAVESPGYFGFYSMLHFLHLKSIEIPSNPQTGFDVDALERSLKTQNPKAVLLSSTFSNPTGATMPDEQKARLTAIAKHHNIAVIEDDTYGDIAFGPSRPLPLKHHDADNVIHLGSFSKSLAPGYRIAWVSGGKYSEDILRCKNLGVLSVPAPNQQAIAAYLHDGGIVRNLKRLRKTYADRMRIFQSAIRHAFPAGTRASAPQGGHFIWIEQPEGFDSVALGRKSIEQGISIAPGIMFSARQNYRRFFRLNTALVWSEQTEDALIKLGQLCSMNFSNGNNYYPSLRNEAPKL